RGETSSVTGDQRILRQFRTTLPALSPDELGSECYGTNVARVAGMKPAPSDQPLSLIPTPWSLVCRAHHGAAGEARAARQQLFERCGGAARRYPRNFLHNADAADEVFQEFSLHLLRGNLRGADPDRGRFRNYVKGTLFHLIADYRRQRRKWPGPLPDDA